MSKPNVNLLAPINQFGYGIVGLNTFLNLSATHNVALFPIGHDEVPDEHRQAVERGKALAGVYDWGAVSVRVWHQFALAEHVGLGKRIGWPFFELRQLQQRERHHMNSLEHIVVASEWGREVCLESGVTTPISVVPPGVDRTIFHEAAASGSLTPDHTVFINVGKWELRKGHDILLRAFNRAFEPTDKVHLKMITHNPLIGPLNERWARQYKTCKMADRIILVPQRFNTQRALALQMAEADCGVFPARAEGWNLDLIECMSCGLHCIATNYSGHTAFVNGENCRLIEVNEFEQAEDGLWFHGDGEWAKLGKTQEDQLVEHMRGVHRQRQVGDLPRHNVPGIETAKRFNWQQTAKHLAETFDL